MAKTKLNAASRAILAQLVLDRVQGPVDLRHAYEEKLAALRDRLNAYIDATYPDADMRILARYRVHENVSSLTFRVLDYTTIVQFSPRAPAVERAEKQYEALRGDKRVTVDLKRTVTLPQGHHHEITGLAGFIGAAREARVAEVTWAAARLERQRAYFKLIKTTQTYEDLCEVWVEANEVVSRIVMPQGSTALAVRVSDADMALIREDQHERVQGLPAAEVVNAER